MLGPFRIRNLGRPTSPANRASYASASRRSSPDAVVAITGPEYDTNVLMNPESKLRYLDDDDGEIVTVGTSLELSQRLSEPVPNIARTILQDPVLARGNNTANTLLPNLLNTHVFEIDRRGNSTQIWGEIEERTRQFRLSEALSQPEPVLNTQFAMQSVLGDDDMAQKLPPQDLSPAFFVETRESLSDVNKGPKKVVRAWLHTSSNDSQVQEKKKTDELVNLVNQEFVNDVSESATYGEIQEDERTRHFKATNPPQLLHEHSHPSGRPAHHTSMRLSDVLNEDAESKEVFEETAPLLESFREDNLTAEGKRQAMEAGERLRLRGIPTFHVGSYRESRPQSSHNDRWALYGTAKHASGAATQPNEQLSSLDNPQVQPMLPAPSKESESATPTEGPLLHAFRTELAKISQPNNQKPMEKQIPDAKPSSIEADARIMPRPRPIPSGSDLEALTRNLVLQTIVSIGSNVETLKTQLQSHVLDVLPEHMNRPRTTPIKYQLRNACSDFKLSVNAATASLIVEPSVEDGLGKKTTDTTYPTLLSATRGLQSITYAIDTLIQRLRMIEDSKVWMANSDQSTTSKSSETLSSNAHETHQSQRAVFEPLKPVPKQALYRDVHAGSGNTNLCTADMEEEQRPRKSTEPTVRFEDTEVRLAYEAVHAESEDINFRTTNVEEEQGVRKSTGQTVRFEDTEVRRAESQIDHFDAEKSTDQHMETSISYRHVPSPMPWEVVGQSRGRQPLKYSASFSSGLPYKHLTPQQGDFQYRRRSIPEPEIRRESRSRSRSPVAKMTRAMPEVHGSNQIAHPRQQPLRQSGLPVRHHYRPDSSSAASRPTRSALRHFGSVNALNHDHKSSGYRPLPQQRPLDLTSAGNAKNTATHPSEHPLAIHSRQSYGTEDKHRVVSTASLRHAKSLSSIRKPPAPLKLGEFRARARDSWEAQPTVTMTVAPPDYEEARKKALNAARPITKRGTLNSAQPSSPLVVTRFPTLEQFESRNVITAPQFPSLPSMEPLIPLRPNAAQRDTEVEINPIPIAGSVHSTAIASSNVYGNNLHQLVSEVEKTESSGDFFRRMTGLTEAPKIPASPISPVRLGPAAPGARLARPFDPLAETATIHRHQLLEGVRRSATVAGLHDRYTATNRRPYSAYFDGNGRVEWDVFTSGNPGASARPRRDNAQPQTMSGRPTTQSEMRSPQRRRTFHSGTSTPVHQDPSTVSSVQSCVQQLQDLGFGTDENGGARRLVVYAQAANGNLGMAIDMIDEEMRAYEERRAEGS